MRLVYKILLVVTLLGGAGWFTMRLARPEAAVVPARRERAVNAVPGSVTVLAERTLQLKSDIGGRVVSSDLDVGSAVQAGAVLLELDKGEVELQIEQLQNDRDATRRRLEIGSPTAYELQNARDQLEFSERQFMLGAVTARDAERVRRAVKQLEQKVELEKVADTQASARLDNDLKVLQRKRDQMSVRSPADGTVSVVYANKGDLIGGGEVVATIIAQERVVEAKISEENFSGIRVGQQAVIRFLSYGSNLYPARVTKILPAADPATQRYIVHLSVDIDPRMLVPGLTGEANITIDARENAIIIPRRALLGRNVFVVKNGRVEVRDVEVGFSSLNVVEILRGVDEGDLVVVDDLDRFRAGDRVSTTAAQ